MIRAFVAWCFILIASGPASALCFQSTGFDFSSSVNNALDHLICLHNEQVKSLNEHADLINAQASLLSDLDSRIYTLESENNALKRRVSDLQDDVSSIESRVSAIENNN